MSENQSSIKPSIEKEDKVKPFEKPVSKEQPKNCFSVEEIEIEEMAIDGICGVY